MAPRSRSWAWWKALFVLSASTSTEALAQTGGDCALGTFPLKPFPLEIVRAAVGRDAGDELNTVVLRATGRCDDGGHRVFVCGRSARTNRAGYLDRDRRFFGIYTTNPVRFQITATGSTAETTCARLVFRH